MRIVCGYNPETESSCSGRTACSACDGTWQVHASGMSTHLLTVCWKRTRLSLEQHSHQSPSLLLLVPQKAFCVSELAADPSLTSVVKMPMVTYQWTQKSV